MGHRLVHGRYVAAVAAAAWMASAGCSGAGNAAERRAAGREDAGLGDGLGGAGGGIDVDNPNGPVQVLDGGATGPDLGEQCMASEAPDDFSVPVCELKAGAESFDPVIEWYWDGGDGWGPPLVVNLTDDNGDGAIDLCDTPDVL